MTKTEHQPLPEIHISARRGERGWFAIECESNIKGIKVPIALVPFKPHAKEIVRAVNNHERLLEALKQLLLEEDAVDGLAQDDWDKAIKKARAAIAAAEVQS